MKVFKEIIESIGRNKKQFAIVLMALLAGMAGGCAAIYFTCFGTLVCINMFLGCAVLVAAGTVGAWALGYIAAITTDNIWGWD